jgi:DNA-binding transcriptional MerR regulator/methylmalonyl-CoA mutase cobalamin-binding subunit
MVEAHQAIKLVARRTGLSAHVIRIWEKRYGAVAPERTGTNRRLYSEEHVERLSLLRNLTQSGHSIGQVAKLPTEKLRQLTANSTSSSGSALLPPASVATAPAFLEDCVAAVKELDARKLEDAFKRAAVELGEQGVLQRVIAPLAQRLGELWLDGSLTGAHEHFATAVIRVFLGKATRAFAGAEQSPVLLVATPAGQLHELGALLAGASATNLGWRITYLGASLPAVEIAGAARQCRARAVALSLVYPEDDPKLPGELGALRQALPQDVPLLVGGRAASAYRTVLKQLGAIEFDNLTKFGAELSRLRRANAEAP